MPAIPVLHRMLFPAPKHGGSIDEPAEAYIRQGNYPAAIDDLNAWISKNVKAYDPATNNITNASVTAYYGLSLQASLLQATLDFKRVSYMQEGLRWLDILRLNVPIQHTSTDGFSSTLAADDNRRLLQFPLQAAQEGIALNPR